MPNGLLYDWEGMATMGRQNPETRFGRKLACSLSVCVLAISNRCSKDSSCTYKGLVTNWPHHNSLQGLHTHVLFLVPERPPTMFVSLGLSGMCTWEAQTEPCRRACGVGLL